MRSPAGSSEGGIEPQLRWYRWVSSAAVLLLLALGTLDSGGEDKATIDSLATRAFSAFGHRQAAEALYPFFSRRVREKVPADLMGATLAAMPPQRLLQVDVELLGPTRATATCQRVWEENDQPADPLVLYLVNEEGEWRLTTCSPGMPSWWPETVEMRDQEVLRAVEMWLTLVEHKDWQGAYELAPYPVRVRYPKTDFVERLSQHQALPVTLVMLKVPAWRDEVNGIPLPSGLTGRVYFVAHLQRKGKLLPFLATPCLHVVREGDRWAVAYHDAAAIAVKALRAVDLYNAAWQSADLEAMRTYLLPQTEGALSDEDLQQTQHWLAPPAEDYECSFDKACLGAIGSDSLVCTATYHMRRQDEETAREFEYRVVFAGTGVNLDPRLAQLPSQTD